MFFGKSPLPLNLSFHVLLKIITSSQLSAQAVRRIKCGILPESSFVNCKMLCSVGHYYSSELTDPKPKPYSCHQSFHSFINQQSLGVFAQPLKMNPIVLAFGLSFSMLFIKILCHRVQMAC